MAPSPPRPAGSPDPAAAEPGRDLLGDGTLTLRFPASLRQAVEQWVWPIDAVPPAAEDGTASIEIERAPGSRLAPPAPPPTIDAGVVAAWREPAGGTYLVFGRGVGVHGIVDPAAQRGRLRIADADPLEGGLLTALAEAFSLAAGLLLARQGRVLVHAAAVVGRDQRAWLLAGDSGSGKTSTALTLARAGFGHIADDQLVLGAEDGRGALRVRGWPRKLTLDVGYGAGASQGARRLVEPESCGPVRRVACAVVAGVLFPRVEANEPTRLEPMAPAEALAGLLRHSPWGLFERDTAPGLLRLLAAFAVLPAYSLRLGSESYGDYAALRRHLPAGLGDAV